MENTFKTELWNQFDAVLDMLENALVKCLTTLWDDDNKFS